MSWQPYVRGSDLGARAGDPESTAVLTYAPIVRGTAPATGFIGLADSTNALTARTIASVDHDVMVLATVLPTTAPSMTVERYIPGSPDLNSLAATGQIVLALNQNGQLGGVALRLLQLGNTTLGPSVGASVAQGFSIAGQTASQAYQAVSVTAFNASDAVVVRNGGSDEIAVVRTIEMTLEVDRDMTLDASGLRLVQLAGSGPRYNATLITGLELAVAPTVAGVRVQMPRFFVGEIVQVRGTGMSTRLFRIGAVAGTRLTLTGDAPITAVAGIDVRRIIAGDPLTGGPFVAIEGTPVHAAADGTTRWIKFRFWNNTKIAGLGSVGIVSGGQTLPAIVASTLYDVTQPDPVANPMRLTVAATTNAGAVAVTQPVFVAGENVFVAWTGPASGNGQYVTGTVAGNVLNVTPAAGASAIPSNVTGITLRRLPVIDVTFTAPIAATGNAVEILALTVANAALIPSFTQESDNAISFASGGTNLTAPSANLVVVIPFAESAITSSGELTSGTVKAPDDPEHWEYNRREAVAEHELRHTQQYNWFGPIWFAAFPMWILDTVLAATTDIEKPAFSAFVSGALNRDANANTTKLTIANMNGIPFAKGDTVQLYKGSEHNEVKLGELAAGAFAVEGSVTIANGDVFVRRRASGQGIFSDVALGILRFGTPGSVMNLAMTLTWGSAFQLIGRAGYLIARLVDNGTLLDATVLNNGMSATLADPTKKGLLANEQRLIVRMKDITINRTVVGAIQDGRITLGAPIALSSDKDVTFDNEDSNRPVEAWFKATIETSGTSLKMKDTAQASQLSNVTNIKIRVNGDITVVRSITPPITDDGTITFGSELPAQSGSVKVAPYETHTPGTLQHWNNYYPATVNPDKLASVTLQAVGSDHLTLAPRDRVRVLYDGNDSFGFTTSVTSVTGDQVDLEQAMPTLPTTNVGEIIVRLAKIGRDDPTGWLDQRLVDDLYDAGWVRWLTDPFSQMHYTVQQHSRGSFWDYFSRVGRYLLGTSSWSFLPAFGWLMWDRVFRGSTPYLAFIEQDASEHSGDLYTSIGRLRGQATVGDGPEATMVVGDIAQYWFWPGTRWIVLPQNANGQQDAPGVHLPNELIAMPFVTAESGPAAPNNGNEPNNNALAAALVAGTTESGSALGDPFYLKNTTDPRDLPVAAGSAAFAADIATRGWVPMEQKIQRNMASYVAFSQPTTGTQRHRMTVRSGLSTPSQDRHAQDEGKQTMFYNIKVDDVTVTVNGVAVAEAGTVTLLQTQRARIAVMPNNDRRYRATVVRPADDQSLQQPEDLVLQARIVDTTADRPVEISRYYKYDPARDQYETGGLRGRGVHLPTDIDIAVRQLNVAVVSKPPVVAALPTAPTFSLYGSSPAGLNVGGEVFVLVAANVLVPGPVAINYTFPQPGSTIDPVVALTDVNGSAGAALRAFLGDGRPFRLAIAADDPPEQPANIQLSVTVGEPGNTSIVTATIPITGHFYAAALIYTVARGGSLLLLCGNIDLSPVTPLDTVAVTLIDGTPAPLVGGTDPELTFTVAGNQITINCNANAQVGKRRLLLTDSANAGNRARRTIEIV